MIEALESTFVRLEFADQILTFKRSLLRNPDSRFFSSPYTICAGENDNTIPE